MRIIKASYKIESPINGKEILNRIEKIGRVCYKAEDSITEDSSIKFIERILKSGHESVIEHESFSVRFICDRGVTHEMVRHRLASYSQESTRYCNYSKDKHDNQLTFIEPCWFNGTKETQATEMYWESAMEEAESYYLSLIAEGWKPQQARSVLPNSLKTEIVVSANLREWRHILTLRTAQSAHPQIREVMVPLLMELKNEIPVLFDDIIPCYTDWEKLNSVK